MLWTVIATTGVIFSAAYLLTMIQRVFYADLGNISAERRGWDLTAREHLALWPMVLLFFVMGVASPYFTRTLDLLGTTYAGRTTRLDSRDPPVSEAETYNSHVPASVVRESGLVSSAATPLATGGAH